jgi:CheY-like chemotaxis protein
VESQIGLGSRFWFSLPAPMCAGAAMADPIVGVRPSSLEGVRVLVVDDHAANRELARLYLTGVGAEISEASDGAEAVASALSLPFDVILMDLNMPGLDGATALARIRAIDGPNDVTPIIALTAEVGAAAKARMAALGFQDVVGKPLEAGALVAAIAGVAAFAPAPAPAATADWS